MIFASKTPRDLNRDPAPIAIWSNYDRAWSRGNYPEALPLPIGWKHDPRPEYDHAQRNEPNPVLVNLRSRIAAGYDDAEEFGWWLGNEYNHETDSWVWDDRAVTYAHIDHARRVLARLARLAELEPTA